VPDREDAQASTPIVRRLKRTHHLAWKTVGVFVIAVLAAAAVHLATQANLRARLMRADPDAIVHDPALRTFAIATGQPAYDRHCASCHGAHMEGDRGRGAPNLADQDWLYGDGRIAEIERTILHGIRSGDPKAWNLADMPAFSQPVPYRRYTMAPLGPDGIRDVIEFLLVSAGKPGDRAAAARGSAIYDNKGQCFDCHETDGKGDTATGVPNLLDDIWLSGDGSRESIYNTVAFGSSGYCPAWARQLDAVTIRSLAVLVYVASHREAPAAASPSTGASAGPGQ
jgi:cytochrome c oxidase cbb3-type subunit III